MIPASAPSTEVIVGLSSVPLGFESWLPRDPAFWSQTEAFMAERGLSVLGILTSFRDAEHTGKSGRGKHRREQMYVVRGNETIAHALFDALGDAEELKQEGNEHFRAKRWNEALATYRTGLGRLPKRRPLETEKGKEREVVDVDDDEEE